MYLLKRAIFHGMFNKCWICGRSPAQILWRSMVCGMTWWPPLQRESSMGQTSTPFIPPSTSSTCLQPLDIAVRNLWKRIFHDFSNICPGLSMIFLVIMVILSMSADTKHARVPACDRSRQACDGHGPGRDGQELSAGLPHSDRRDRGLRPLGISWAVVGSGGDVMGWVIWYGGFQLVMEVPLYCWMVFVNGKIPAFEMDDDWGSPYHLGNPHMEWLGILLGFNCWELWEHSGETLEIWNYWQWSGTIGDNWESFHRMLRIYL